MRVLIAGATGFVGRNLALDFADVPDVDVRGLVRDRNADAGVAAAGVEVHEGDVETQRGLARAFEGVDAAYFLVHMMGRGENWASREAEAAHEFGAAARSAGVERVLYLGGLGDENASAHLRSRHEVAEALRDAGPLLTYFRAAMIVGAGSESFELLRSIAERLPAIPTPDWLHSRSQPIGIRDTVAYLRQALTIPQTAGREIQIGGPDVLTHFEAIDAMSRELGRKPLRRANVPGATPGAVAAAAAAVTTGNDEVAAAITQGLPGDTVVTDPSGMELFGIQPESFSVSLQRALEAEEVAA
jgi:uncharacterized protein YbjT (DUF2867 family)